MLDVVVVGEAADPGLDVTYELWLNPLPAPVTLLEPSKLKIE